VNKNVFFGVISIDKPISRLYIEPFYSSAHLGGDDLLGLFFLGRLVGVTSSLLVFGLVLRVSHDGNVVRMVTNFSPRLYPKMAKDLVRAAAGN